MAVSEALRQGSCSMASRTGLTLEKSTLFSAQTCGLCGARTALQFPQSPTLQHISFHAVRNDACRQPVDELHQVVIKNSSGETIRWRKTPSTVPTLTHTPHLDRRRFLLVPLLLTGALAQVDPASAWAPAKIDFSAAPQAQFDTSDARFREAADLFQQALSTGSVQSEERLWSEIIERVGDSKADWAQDILARAYGNRGNARSRQGKREEALADYDVSIQLAPYSVDPVLNRGVVLESLGRYSEAASDYQAVLAAEPNDPAAWNNLGNVASAQGKWQEALDSYGRAVRLAPEFSFAAGNYALALYQVGRDNEALKQFRTLLRKYPEFPDMRAALAVSLYHVGLTREAETNWSRLEDLRYKDRTWVRGTRRWPPRLADELEAFLDVKATSK